MATSKRQAPAGVCYGRTHSNEAEFHYAAATACLAKPCRTQIQVCLRCEVATRTDRSESATSQRRTWLPSAPAGFTRAPGPMASIVLSDNVDPLTLDVKTLKRIYLRESHRASLHALSYALIAIDCWNIGLHRRGCSAIVCVCVAVDSHEIRIDACLLPFTIL